MAEHPVSGPHDDNSVAPSVDAFFDTDHYNLEAARRDRPEFRELVPRMSALYDGAAALIPLASALLYGRTLLLCHKALLGAAGNIGRGHPEDAGAITRRAIEMAGIACAVKHDPANLDRWRAKEQREARRDARSRGQRPRPVIPEIKWPPNHGLLESLRSEMGLLSDIYVHFTPEYERRQNWHHDPQGAQVQIFLPYHCPDEMVIKQQLVLLAGFHLKMLGLLDECYDQAFSRDTSWRQMYDKARAARDELGNAFCRETNRGSPDRRGRGVRYPMIAAIYARKSTEHGRS